MISIPSPTILMRSYFSTYYLWAANHYAELAAAVENEKSDIPQFNIKQRVYVVSAVHCAVAFLEACINELFMDAADKHEGCTQILDLNSRNLIATFWEFTNERKHTRFSVLEKYEIILRFCNKAKLEEKRQPYQDVVLLIKLRNELMHYKPKTYGGKVQYKFIDQLSSKFSENPLTIGSGNPYFPDKCLGSPCAIWAVRAVRQFTDEFFYRLNIKPNYQHVSFES